MYLLRPLVPPVSFRADAIRSVRPVGTEQRNSEEILLGSATDTHAGEPRGQFRNDRIGFTRPAILLPVPAPVPDDDDGDDGSMYLRFLRGREDETGQERRIPENRKKRASIVKTRARRNLNAVLMAARPRRDGTFHHSLFTNSRRDRGDRGTGAFPASPLNRRGSFVSRGETGNATRKVSPPPRFFPRARARTCNGAAVLKGTDIRERDEKSVLVEQGRRPPGKNTKKKG